MFAAEHIWECTGTCEMYCAEQITNKSFINVPNLVMHKWLLNHGLTTSECNYKGCTSNCLPIADGDAENSSKMDHRPFN